MAPHSIGGESATTARRPGCLVPASANKVLFICGVRESWAAAPRLVLRTSPRAPGTSCTLHPHPRVARSPGAPPCAPAHPTCSFPQARAGDGLPAKPRNSTCGHNLHLHFPRGTTALAPNTAPLSVRHKKMLFHEVLFPSPKGISLSISAPVKFWAPVYPRPRKGTNTSCTVTMVPAGLRDRLQGGGRGDPQGEDTGFRRLGRQTSEKTTRSSLLLVKPMWSPPRPCWLDPVTHCQLRKHSKREMSLP